MDKEIFVQNIKKYCTQRGIKPTVACRESGVGTSFINNIEARGQVPSIEKVYMLATYLGVTINDLVGMESQDHLASPALTAEELQTVLAYRRAAPELQAAVRRVLGMD